MRINLSKKEAKLLLRPRRRTEEGDTDVKSFRRTSSELLVFVATEKCLVPIQWLALPVLFEIKVIISHVDGY